MTGGSPATQSAAAKPRVVLITSSQFWVKGNGLAARTNALVHFLAQHYSLAVAYLNPASQNDFRLVRNFNATFDLFVLGQPGEQPNPAALVQRFRHFFGESSPPAAYIVVQTELSYMLDAIPPQGRTFLDTNDLVSDRTQSMADHGVRDHFPLTRDQESALMQRYDRIICIQAAEHAQVAAWLGGDRVVLAPHPVSPVDLPVRETASVVGFVASRWHANVDGLAWFLKRVWPKLAAAKLRLDVYGYIEEAFRGVSIPNVRFRGYVDDLSTCYAQIDIAINPVRYGAGLKIKTVESMAYGLPLVVSKQGASGLEALAGKAFLLAEDAVSFAESITRLAGDRALRQTLVHAAQSHANDNFGSDHCFGDLARQINLASAG